jgi:thymidylate synthase (FAD)
MAGKQGQKNKQGSEDGLSIHDADDAREDIKHAFKMARSSYEQLLALGVSRELARMVIPVSQYSRMRASANLRNWLAFCSLRMAPEAQWEIRQYANIVGDIIKNRFPKTWELYNEEQNGNT